MKGFFGLLGVLAVIGGVVSVADGDGPSRQRAASFDAQRGRNIEAVDKYLELVDKALVAIEGNGRAVEIAISRVVKHVKRECPAIASGAPSDQSRWRVGLGITEELGTAADHANGVIIGRLLQSSEQLQWGSPVIASATHRGVSAAATQAALARPRICVVLRDWRQGRFVRVPRRLAEFSQEFAAESEAARL